MSAKKTRLKDRLPLQSFILDQLGVKNFDEIATILNTNDDFEEFTVEGQTGFLSVLQANLTKIKFSQEKLRQYDENIVIHTHEINKTRKKQPLKIRWKYYQYLALLFMEIYLDLYFEDEDELLESLNKHLATFTSSNPDANLDDYKQDELNKIAFWMATGSGKTLIMHVNALQFNHYQEKSDKSKDIGRFILLTPKPGLSLQHLDDFIESGFRACLVSKQIEHSLLTLPIATTPQVSILSIQQLRDDAGPETFATEEFESRNFVMVDEGHLGAGSGEGGAWRSRRKQLCSDGFSTEYSATFEQAVMNKDAIEAKIDQEYAKSIIFDYSYRRFHADGYGKEWQNHMILGISGGEQQFVFLTAAMLTFYQQMKLYSDDIEQLKQFNIEKPLWIFVGARVGAYGSKPSDVIEIIEYYRRFIEEQDSTVSIIDTILNGEPGLLDEEGNNEVFSENFTFIADMSAEKIYSEILRTLLNGKGSGPLILEHLTGEKVGELLLRIGDNEPFGVIDVGIPTTVKKIAKQVGINVTTSHFTTSYFQAITKDPNCPINVLIGSNKFIEGWSCWRVSMMGLMEMGKGTGSKIIQLFGRGVRLKGHGFSLKRSKGSKAQSGIEIPDSLTSLETLNIFGIKSHYMKKFLNEILKEDLGPKDTTTINIPTSTQLPNPKEVSLKYLYLDESKDFTKDGDTLEFGSIPNALKQRRVKLDLYPRIVSIASENSDNTDVVAKPNRHLDVANLSLIDWGITYKKLLERKREKNYHNALINPSKIKPLFDDSSWYEILCPENILAVNNLEHNIQSWQKIVDKLALLYLDRIYASSKDEWQRNHLKLGALAEGDSNLIDEWEMEIDTSQSTIILQAKELRDNYSQGKPVEVSHPKFSGSHYTRHLYNPLLYLRKGVDSVNISPVPLNEGEDEFVKDLHQYYDANENQMIKHEMYLLRNQSKTGIAFFSDGNFFPDFIMWLIVGDHQYITFIDPHGLYHATKGLEDPKISLSSKMGKITDDIRKGNNDQEITLNSFIISVTQRDTLKERWGGELEKSDFTDSNVLFPKDDKASYIETMLHKIIPEISSS